MALKRINKELTDLGRYVQSVPLFSDGSHRLLARQSAKAGCSSTTMAQRLHTALQDYRLMLYTQ